MDVYRNIQQRQKEQEGPNLVWHVLKEHYSINWTRAKIVPNEEHWYKSKFKEHVYITINKNILSEPTVQLFKVWKSVIAHQNNLLMFLNVSCGSMLLFLQYCLSIFFTESDIRLILSKRLKYIAFSFQIFNPQEHNALLRNDNNHQIEVFSKI